MTAFCMLWGCQKPNEAVPVVPKADFTVALNPNTVQSDYAEVVVRHNGAKDATWFGFITEDQETAVKDLIEARLPGLDRKTLHVGNAQTVALRSLEEVKTYRYVAFAVDPDNKVYGTPGSLAFSTNPNFTVAFTAEAAEVNPTQASFTVTHDGNEVLTYAAIVTEDLTAETDALIAADYADKVADGKLKDGVQLLSGTSATVTMDELKHATDYRFIVYGIYDDGSAVIQYGTPAEVSFSTPLDLNLVNFSAETSNLTKESVDIAVSYDTAVDDLTWYGFLTEDLTSEASTLIAAAVADVEESDWKAGAKTVSIGGLTALTTYRYIVTGINADGVYGTPADIQFITLSDVYDNTVFTVAASEITTSSVTLTITHNGEAEFEYCGFFTEDLESPVVSVAIPADADQHLMSGLEKVISVNDLAPLTQYRYIVVGRVNGNEYGTRGEAVFTTADDAVPASYDDFLGAWSMLQGETTYEFEVQEKMAGTSYTIVGLNGATTARYGIGTPLIVEALFVDGKMTVACQEISEPYVDSYDDNTYTDMFCGVYVGATDGKDYVDHTVGRTVVTFAFMETGNVQLRAGKSEDGEPYYGMDFFQVSPSGSIYAQDTYTTPLPNEAKKAAVPSDEYLAWLGTWYIATNVYQYDSSNQYIGDEVQQLPIVISKDVTNESYLVSGIGPANSNYSVPMHFEDGKLVAHPQTVYTWTHPQAGEIKELFVGIYGEGDSAMWTWSPDLTLFTGTIGADGKATLTPGQASDGTDFNGFQFIQYYSAGAYGYGGSYDLPNTLSRTPAASFVPQACAPKASVRGGVSHVRVPLSRKEAVKSHVK